MEKLKTIDWVKWIIAGLGVWLFVYPIPYNLLATLLVVIPLLTLVAHGVAAGRPGISTLFDGVMNNQSRFSPITHMIFAAVPLGFRIFRDYDPAHMGTVVLAGLAAALVVFLLVVATHRVAEPKKEPMNFFILGFVLLVYAPASMFTVNCLYDNHPPTRHQVDVLEKYRPSSKADADYYLRVSSWDTGSEPVSIEVNPEQYHQSNAGDRVDIYVGEGLFRVGWYRVGL